MKHRRADPCLALVFGLCGFIFSVSCCEVKAEDTTPTRAPGVAADNPLFGHALFEVGDVKDDPPILMIEKLSSNNADELSQFLWAQIAKDARKAPREFTAKELVDGLNNVLLGTWSIYTDSRFKGVNLSPETQKLKAYNPMARDLIWLNRLLLQEAYPEFLRKKEYTPPDKPFVRQVRTRANPNDPAGPTYPCKAQRNDDVWVDVYDVDRWIDEAKERGKAPKDASIQSLVPYLNHIPLTGI